MPPAQSVSCCAVQRKGPYLRPCSSQSITASIFLIVNFLMLSSLLFLTQEPTVNPAVNSVSSLCMRAAIAQTHSIHRVYQMCTPQNTWEDCKHLLGTYLVEAPGGQHSGEVVLVAVAQAPGDIVRLEIVPAVLLENLGAQQERA